MTWTTLLTCIGGTVSSCSPLTTQLTYINILIVLLN